MNGKETRIGANRSACANYDLHSKKYPIFVLGTIFFQRKNRTKNVCPDRTLLNAATGYSKKVWEGDICL